MGRPTLCCALIAAIAVGAILAATQARAQTNPIPTGSISIELENLGQLPGTAGDPLAGTHVGDDRFFVAGQGGEVWFMQNGSFSGNEFFDTGDVAGGLPLIASGERGLLGVAFHPDFAIEDALGEGLFYTYTSESKGSNTPDFFHPEMGTTGGDHHTVIREWQVDAINPNRIDHTSSRVLMRIQQPQSNHNGGALAFDTAGNLYISLGDGGGANDHSGGTGNNFDGHTNSPGAGMPHGNAQDLTNILGSIIRINPLGNDGANGEYGVPNDNPFIGQTGVVEEIWASGLRNPYRMTFDRATGDLWTGDVGQSAREEVNLVTAGGNYGWVTLEGTQVNFSGYTMSGFTAPVGEYTSSDGHSVIGGYVYRGSNAELQGQYIFGDYAGPSFQQGRLFYMDPGTGDIQEFMIDPAGDSIPTGARLVGFGEDASGDVYAFFNNGSVVRIVPEPATCALALAGVVSLMLFVVRNRANT